MLWTHGQKPLDRGESIDVVCLDFMTAFDTVPPKRMIGKLKSYGIEYYTLRWIQAFLSDRVQQVSVNGINSKWANVTSGIPQGSVLGLILFVLYINDLPENIVSNVYMLADDTKVFKMINSPNDQHTLQNDLDYLTSWSSEWLLQFHPDKCHLMTWEKQLQQEYAYKLKIDNTAHKLGEIEEQKDIGVIVDSNLEFDKHINQKINKANSIMAAIRRSFTTLNHHNFVPLYKALVRSHSDYAISIWSSCALPPCSLLYRGEGQVKYCRATLSFHSFLLALPLSIFHPPPIFSCPSSRSPPITFPFSCILDVFPPLLSLLVCLHPFLLSGLPISSCFSPIFLLGCIASQPLSLGRSSFFCPPSLFLLFAEPSYSHTLAAYVVVVLSMPLSPDHTGMLV